MSAAVFRCAACGTLNRVPQDRVDDKPRCGRCKNELDPDAIPQDVDAAGLQATVSSCPAPVLVDFWAPWCAPCRMAAPIVEAVAKDRAGKLVALKVNTDAVPEAGRDFGIMSIPTFVLFVHGTEVRRRSGISGKSDLDHWIDHAIAQAR